MTASWGKRGTCTIHTKEKRENGLKRAFAENKTVDLYLGFCKINDSYWMTDLDRWFKLEDR